MTHGALETRDLEGLGLRILEQVNEAVAIITPDLRLAWVNREFCRLTGYGREEVLGQPLTVFRSGMHDDGEYDRIKKAVFEHGRWHGEVWRRKKSGEMFPAWLTISAVYDEDRQLEYFVDLFVDISKIRRQREELESLVNRDPLTGLPNRRLFWDRLENAVRRSERSQRPFGLLFIDLDNFKQINDHEGHRVGDAVLTGVARTLQSCLRDCDTIARVGGDEFAVLLEEANLAEGADNILRRVRASLEQVPMPAPDALATGASLGLALFPRDGSDAANLYEAADRSMYADKQKRR